MHRSAVLRHLPGCYAAYRSATALGGAADDDVAVRDGHDFMPLSGTITAERVALVRGALPGGGRQFLVRARAFLPKGTFLGFYTGAIAPGGASPTDYAFDMSRSVTHSTTIEPFGDADRISYKSRCRHVLANMNEPREGTHANAILVLQDFWHHEVEGGQPGVCYRGVAAFTCCDVQKHEELTWHYGPGYEPTRRSKGYTAGLPCAAVLGDEEFLPDESQGAVRAYAERQQKIPLACVFPLERRQRRLRAGFNRSDSEEEDVEAIAYAARAAKRRARDPVWILATFDEDVAKQLIEISVEAFPREVEQLNEEWVRDYFQSDGRARPDRVCLCVFDPENETRVRGFALVIYDQQTSHVDKLAVRLMHRGKGIASRLLDTVIELARADDARAPTAERVTLMADVRNDVAVRLYGRKGFVVDHRVPDAYGEGTEGVVMSRVVNPAPQGAQSSAGTTA